MIEAPSTPQFAAVVRFWPRRARLGVRALVNLLGAISASVLVWAATARQLFDGLDGSIEGGLVGMAAFNLLLFGPDSVRLSLQWLLRRPSLVLDREGVVTDGTLYPGCARVRWPEILSVWIRQLWLRGPVAFIAVDLTPEFIRRQPPWHRFRLSLLRVLGRRRFEIPFLGLAAPAAEVEAALSAGRAECLASTYA